MTRRTVFVDTWAWIAAMVEDDADRPRFVRLSAELRAHRALSITSNFVLAESLTRLRYDGSHALAIKLANLVDTMAEAAAL